MSKMSLEESRNKSTTPTETPMLHFRMGGGMVKIKEMLRLLLPIVPENTGSDRLQVQERSLSGNWRFRFSRRVCARAADGVKALPLPWMITVESIQEITEVPFSPPPSGALTHGSLGASRRHSTRRRSRQGYLSRLLAFTLPQTHLCW